jgi:hypothetical protein
MKSLVGWPCRAVGCRTARVLDGCGGRRKQVRQINAQRRGSSVPELRYVSRRSGTVRGACERSRAQQPLCRGRERAVQVPDSSSINRDAAISNTSFVCWARTPGSGLCGMPSGSPSGLAPGCPAAVRRRRCRRSPAGGARAVADPHGCMRRCAPARRSGRSRRWPAASAAAPRRRLRQRRRSCVEDPAQPLGGEPRSCRIPGNATPMMEDPGCPLTGPRR